MTGRLVNTPGVLGYLLAFVVAVVAFSYGVQLASGGLETANPLVGPALFLYVSLMLAGVPVALPVCVLLVLHAVCRDFEDQWVHVATAALVTAPLALAVGAMVDSADRAAVVLGMPLAMALGRAAVIPLVHRRAGRVPSGRSAIGPGPPAPVTLARRSLPMSGRQR